MIHNQWFPCHIHNQANFDNPFINGKGFIYLNISKMSIWWWWVIYIDTQTQVEDPFSRCRLLIFVYISYCSLQVPYCSQRVPHTRMKEPCYYLHSTVARLKITDCPSAPCLFSSRSSHVSFSPPFTQPAVAISPTPRRQYVTGCSTWLDLSDLQIWNSSLRSACEPISLNHHHQYAYTRACTLGIFLHHSTSLLASHTLYRPLVTDYTCCFTLVLIPQHLIPLTLKVH